MGGELDRLSALFAGARRLPRDGREGFLASACGTDEALRREVERLLEAHDAAGEDDRLHPRLRGVPALAPRVGDGTGDAADALPVVEGFRTLSRLAEGGMGSVYVAEQARPRRLVALKVLRPEVATPEVRRRFEREAELLARLAHPGIARVLLHGTTTGPGEPRPFIAMELVEGKPLTQATAGLDLRARVAVLADVADAVAHAHAKGVIHRDIKPDNVLVPADGRPKVVDFGIARLAGDEGTLHTRAGHLLGTLAYMSPEQARGDVASVDTRSDVYSLGVVAYEVLCGRHPLGDVRGTFSEILQRILHGRPAEPAAADLRLRGDLSLILSKAMAKDPEDRYPGASALAGDLRRHLADEPILARPPSGAYQVRRFLRRHKALVGGSALVVALLATGLVLSLRLAHDEGQARARADANAAALTEAVGERDVEVAALALREDDAESATRALDDVPASRRAWEWRYLAARADESASFEPIEGGPVLAATLAPSGAAWQGTVAGGSRLVLRAGARTPERVATPSGLRLAALGRLGERGVAALQHGTAFRIVGEGGEAVVEARLSRDARIQSFAFSPDGGRLAIAQDGGQGWCPLTVLDAATGATQRTAAASEIETRALAFSPDGLVLAAAGGWDGSVRLVELGSLVARRTLVGHVAAVECVAFSPDGRLAATASDDWTVRLWEVATATERARLVGHRAAVLGVAFSPDGALVASASRDGTVRTWNVASGAPERVYLGHRGAVHAVAFAAGRGALVSLGADGRRTWRLGADPHVLRVHRGPEEGNRYPYVYAARFSPHGKRLASAGWDQTVRIVDVATSTLSRTLALDVGEVLALRWCPDGRSVVAGHRRLVRCDVESGATLARADLERDVSSLVTLHDGTRILAGDAGGTVRLLNLSDLGVVATWDLGRSGVADVDVAAGDRAFAALTDRGDVEVRALPGGERIWHGRAHEGGEFGAVAFSPDGRLLATAGSDRRVRLWDASTGRSVRTVQGQTAPVYALAWLPDGSRLLSGDRRGLVRVSDPANGRTRLELRGHTGYVYALDVSPDGRTIASASGDNTVRLWTTVRSAER